MFLAHFPNFWGKKDFFAKSGSVTHGFLTPCQNLENNNDTIPRKCLSRWKDGQTLFHRTLLDAARGPIKSLHQRKSQQNY